MTPNAAVQANSHAHCSGKRVSLRAMLDLPTPQTLAGLCGLASVAWLPAAVSYLCRTGVYSDCHRVSDELAPAY